MIEVEWLAERDEEAWKALAMLLLQLPGPLDAQLQRDNGLTLFEYLVLSTLSMSEGDTMRMTELAGIVNGTLSRLSNVVKRCQARGWVTRTDDPSDGRCQLVGLTDAGRDLVVQAAPGHVAEVRRLVIAPLTERQRDSLIAIGQRVGAALKD